MTGANAVVLDIGGEVGALVVRASDELAGAELEICPVGRRGEVPDEGGTWWIGEWRGQHGREHVASAHGPAWPHVGVVARATLGRVEHAAVFPALRDGSYELWVRPDGPTALVATVRGGAVVAAEWPRGQG
ncbi:MAG TPA: hypothetical protein VE442_07620 [Jatrophihabitans sp.]|nr:hypothetical protein [Jatrophihabitans sp.]